MKHVRINFIAVEDMYRKLGIAKFDQIRMQLAYIYAYASLRKFCICLKYVEVTRTVEQKHFRQLAYHR